MKKILSIIGVWLAIALIAASAYATTPASTTQGLAKTGDQAVLTFVATAGGAGDPTAHLFASTAVTSSILSQIKGYYITEVRTSPGGTAPTAGSTVVINTSDSPTLDILGGVATCSDTVTTRFIPKLNATASVYGGASVTGGLTLVISGNSVNSAIITVTVTMWKN